MAAATSVHVVAIIEPIIQHADWFFPDGKAAYLSTSSPLLSMHHRVLERYCTHLAQLFQFCTCAHIVHIVSFIHSL